MGNADELVRGAEATMDHIASLSRKIDVLREKQWAAEDQFLHRVKILYSEKVLDAGYLRFIAENVGPCFFQDEWEDRWQQAGLPALDTLLDLWVEEIKYRPNGTHGSWTNRDPDTGEAPDWVSAVPDLDNPMPPRGQNIVYVLYDSLNRPCYVGSTGDFPARLKWHLKDGKPVAVWVAFPCETRTAAYALEDRLLKEHMPYLNKKRRA